MATFSRYYCKTFSKPGSTFVALTEDKRKLVLAFYAVSITAVLYTLVYVLLILGGGQPFKPWLNISQASYYRYNVFFCAPSMFLGWILAAGVVHVLSRMFTAGGSFEQMLATMGFGLSVASWTTGVHDLLTSFLGAVGIIDQHEYELALNSPTVWRTVLWILMGAYLVWFVILFSKAAKAVYKTGTVASVLLGTIAFIVYQAFFLIFNR